MVIVIYFVTGAAPHQTFLELVTDLWCISILDYIRIIVLDQKTSNLQGKPGDLKATHSARRDAIAHKIIERDPDDIADVVYDDDDVHDFAHHNARNIHYYDGHFHDDFHVELPVALPEEVEDGGELGTVAKLWLILKCFQPMFNLDVINL